MSASNIFNFNKKPIVYIKKSKIKNAGEGLFAKKFILKNTFVVVYHGDKVNKKKINNMYLKNPEEYKKTNKYFRDTPNSYVIKGVKAEKNLNLCGVYVNDAGSINCKPNEVTKEVLQKYVNTLKFCNLSVMDTEDYPIYVSSKRIKKREELYAHYGIGHWLIHIGCTPDELVDLDKKYNFSSFYP